MSTLQESPRIGSYSEEDFDKVVDVNLKGTFLVTQAAASLMKEQQLPGSIVNIANIVVRNGKIGQANYSSNIT